MEIEMINCPYSMHYHIKGNEKFCMKSSFDSKKTSLKQPPRRPGRHTLDLSRYDNG